MAINTLIHNRNNPELFNETELSQILKKLNEWDKQINPSPRSGFVARFSKNKTWASEIANYIHKEIDPPAVGRMESIKRRLFNK